MKELNHEQVAEAFDEIAAIFTRLSGTFRLSGAAGGDAPSNGKARGKPAARTVVGPTEPSDEHDEDSIREALKQLAVAKGKDTMVAALASVGAAKLGDVDESQYGELMTNITAAMEAAEEEPAPAKKTAAKKTAAKAKAVTLEQVTEAAKALIDADKPAYLKLVKKTGKPSEMDEDGYAAALAAFQAAMPAEEGEDDLL